MTRDDDPAATTSGGDSHSDGQDMEPLIERHLQWLQEFAHRKLSPLLRTKAETGDIVQDALIQFLKYGPRIRVNSDGQLRALLGRIVENVIRDKYDWFTARRRALAKERPLPPDTLLNLSSQNKEVETPSQLVHKNEQEAWVRLGLELLDPDDRRALILRDWDRLPYIEIGKRLGVSEHTARRRYMKSLTLLMEVVQSLRTGQIDTALETSGKEPDQ